MHWLVEEKSNRTQFLEEAVELAPKGTASLLVDAMWFHVTNFKLWQICFDYDNDFACMERETKLAIELNPNYTEGHRQYGLLLYDLGRFEEARIAL